MPRDQDAVNQFRHDLARHLAGFVDNLIQCHRHAASLAYEKNFDKGAAGAGEETSEPSSRKTLLNCPGREAKAELRMQNKISDN